MALRSYVVYCKNCLVGYMVTVGELPLYVHHMIRFVYYTETVF